MASVGHVACEDCGKDFTDATLFRAHYHTHTHPFQCAGCNHRFRTRVGYGKAGSKGRDSRILVNNKFLLDLMYYNVLGCSKAGGISTPVQGADVGGTKWLVLIFLAP